MKTRPKPKALSWIPVKRGPIFCSPACGADCTHAAFLKAHSDAALLCAKLDKTTKLKGWIPNIWENLGWHHSAISKCGRIKVHPNTGTNCTAFLGEPDGPGGKWAEHGNTPASAVRNVVLVAKNELAKISATIEGLSP